LYPSDLTETCILVGVMPDCRLINLRDRIVFIAVALANCGLALLLFFLMESYYARLMSKITFIYRQTLGYTPSFRSQRKVEQLLTRLYLSPAVVDGALSMGPLNAYKPMAAID